MAAHEVDFDVEAAADRVGQAFDEGAAGVLDEMEGTPALNINYVDVNAELARNAVKNNVEVANAQAQRLPDEQIDVQQLK